MDARRFVENLHHQRKGDEESIGNETENIKSDERETPHPTLKKEAKQKNEDQWQQVQGNPG